MKSWPKIHGNAFREFIDYKDISVVKKTQFKLLIMLMLKLL